MYSQCSCFGASGADSQLLIETFFGLEMGVRSSAGGVSVSCFARHSVISSFV